ncbi:MAG: hypothetical protein IV086_10405 [Hyphomonadaceae bacterium]|nr:hypothetical protein [Hyphomonadaceae bacterium]
MRKTESPFLEAANVHRPHTGRRQFSEIEPIFKKKESKMIVRLQSAEFVGAPILETKAFMLRFQTPNGSRPLSFEQLHAIGDTYGGALNHSQRPFVAKATYIGDIDTDHAYVAELISLTDDAIDLRKEAENELCRAVDLVTKQQRAGIVEGTSA